MKNATGKIKEVAEHISQTDATHFATTKTKKLPNRVKKAEAAQLGFFKAACAAGISAYDAAILTKHAMPDIGQIDPRLLGMGIGGLAGAGMGALAGGKNNRGKGALLGGAAGAGFGGLAGAMLPGTGGIFGQAHIPGGAAGAGAAGAGGAGAAAATPPTADKGLSAFLNTGGPTNEIGNQMTTPGAIKSVGLSQLADLQKHLANAPQQFQREQQLHQMQNQPQPGRVAGFRGLVDDYNNFTKSHNQKIDDDLAAKDNASNRIDMTGAPGTIDTSPQLQELAKEKAMRTQIAALRKQLGLDQ